MIYKQLNELINRIDSSLREQVVKEFPDGHWVRRYPNLQVVIDHLAVSIKLTGYRREHDYIIFKLDPYYNSLTLSHYGCKVFEETLTEIEPLQTIILNIFSQETL